MYLSEEVKAALTRASQRPRFFRVATWYQFEKAATANKFRDLLVGSGLMDMGDADLERPAVAVIYGGEGFVIVHEPPGFDLDSLLETIKENP